MSYKGLCIIPEGRPQKNYNGIRAEIYKVSSIKKLDTFLNYAENMKLGVLYLSAEYGVVYADDYVTYSKIPIYKYKGMQLLLWSKVVAEQLYRACLDNFVSVIYLMGCYMYYRYLIKELELKGIQVILPKI